VTIHSQTTAKIIGRTATYCKAHSMPLCSERQKQTNGAIKCKTNNEP